MKGQFALRVTASMVLGSFTVYALNYVTSGFIFAINVAIGVVATLVLLVIFTSIARSRKKDEQEEVANAKLRARIRTEKSTSFFLEERTATNDNLSVVQWMLMSDLFSPETRKHEKPVLTGHSHSGKYHEWNKPEERHPIREDSNRHELYRDDVAPLGETSPHRGIDTSDQDSKRDTTSFEPSFPNHSEIKHESESPTVHHTNEPSVTHHETPSYTPEPDTTSYSQDNNPSMGD